MAVTSVLLKGIGGGVTEVGAAIEKRASGIVVYSSHVGYEGESSGDDCPGHPDDVKKMILTAAQMDKSCSFVSIIDGTGIY